MLGSFNFSILLIEAASSTEILQRPLSFAFTLLVVRPSFLASSLCVMPFQLERRVALLSSSNITSFAPLRRIYATRL